MLDRTRVRRLFAEADELPVDQVAAFLDRECGADVALRREVESLLSAAARRPGFLGAPTAIPGSLPGISGEGAGTAIGHYRLIEEIGQGGFGTVYAAEQSEPVRRRVAVKIIKLGMDTRAVITRFEAERQALAMMDHENIARVFDAGATESGRPYFVMELVAGDPITEYCDKHNLNIAERLGVFVQVCRAVQHAHAKGVIHRDIKPGNVLVTTQDAKPHAKVIDFGIAKATQRSQAERTIFTERRQFVGTPEYMSPEQADGSLSADTRTDVYSLGVLLYELLTGATPFDPKALRSAAYGEIQRIIREVEPEKPSTRLSHSGMLAEVAHQRRAESTRLTAQVRGDLDWIVMRCLEKDRARRYDTVEALAADVVRHLASEPVTAAPPSQAYRVRKFVSRNRGTVAAAAVMLVVLVLGTVGTTWGMIHARRAEKVAEQQRDRATAVRDFLAKTLQGVAPQVARGRNTELLAALMDKAAARINDGELSGDQEAERELRVVVARVYEQLGRFDEARRLLEPLGEGEALGPEARVRLLQLRADLALAASRVDEARELLDGTEALMGEALSVDPRARLDLLQGRARLAKAMNLHEVAADYRWQSVAAARALPNPDHEAIAAQLHGMGESYKLLGRDDEALKAWQEALEELSKSEGLVPGASDSPVQVGVLLSRSDYYAQHRQTDLAMADLKEAQRVAERVLPPNHPLMPTLHYALSNIHLHKGRLAEAMAELQAYVEANAAVYGREDLRVADAMDLVADFHAMMRRWQQALDVATEADRIRAIHLSPEACAARNAWTTIADSLCRLGRSSEGVAVAERAVALQSGMPDLSSREKVTGRFRLMNCLYAAGRLGDVVSQGREVLATYSADPGVNTYSALDNIYALTTIAMLDLNDPRMLGECERLLRASIAERLKRAKAGDGRVALAQVQLGRAIAHQEMAAGAAGALAEGVAPREADVERLLEAESLINSNFQLVVDKLGRADTVASVKDIRDAANTLVALYEWWDRTEPGGGKLALAQQWRDRLEETLKSIEAGASRRK